MSLLSRTPIPVALGLSIACGFLLAHFTAHFMGLWS